MMPCNQTRDCSFPNKSDYYYYGRVDKCHCNVWRKLFGYFTCNVSNKWNPRDIPTLKILIWLQLYAHIGLRTCCNPHHHLTPLSARKQTSNIHSTWPSEWNPLNSFLFDTSVCHSNSASPREASQSFLPIASSPLQVRSAVRKRWHRWQDNHSLRMRVARAMSIPTSPTRISFHSIKQTTAVWAGEWVHNRNRVWENGLNPAVKFEQLEWFVYTRPQRVSVGPSLRVRVALASKQPETHRHTG